MSAWSALVPFVWEQFIAGDAASVAFVAPFAYRAISPLSGPGTFDPGAELLLVNSFVARTELPLRSRAMRQTPNPGFAAFLGY